MRRQGPHRREARVDPRNRSEEKAPKPDARWLRAGEHLAIDPSAVHASPQGLFWLFGPGCVENERVGDVAIVHIRGPLEHHDDSWWSDSYEGILSRIETAITGQDVVERHARENSWRTGYKPIEAVPPSELLCCIDSPGGVVAGLNESVFATQRLLKESGIPSTAFPNEMACSAAYAWACAFDQIVCPPSAIVGSVGVISTMVSQARKNKADGYDVELITSGARKADGHVHQTITSAAIEAERARVMKLAKAFWRLVGDARGMKPDQLKALEAGIFLGADAKSKGLVDRVESFDQLIGSLSGGGTRKGGKTGGNETDRRVSVPVSVALLDTSRKRVATSSQQGSAPRETKTMDLDAKIAKLEAKLLVTTDAAERTRLMGNIGNLMAAKKAMDEDDDEDDEDDEEKKTKKASAGGTPVPTASPAAPAPSAARKTKREDEEDEEEEESKKAALQLIERATGLKGAAALGATAAMFTRLETVEKTTKTLQQTADANERATLIEKVRAYVPQSQIDWLATQKLASVRSFVEHATKGPALVATEEGALLRPNVNATPGTFEALPKEVQEMITSAVHAFPSEYGAEAKTKYRAELVRRHHEAIAKAGKGQY